MQETDNIIQSILSKEKKSLVKQIFQTLLLISIIMCCFYLVDFFDNKPGVTKAYENCLKLKDIVGSVGDNPRIQNWVNNRPETAF